LVWKLRAALIPVIEDEIRRHPEFEETLENTRQGLISSRTMLRGMADMFEALPDADKE